MKTAMFSFFLLFGLKVFAYPVPPIVAALISGLPLDAHVLEEAPRFPGGTEALHRFFSTKLRYPRQAVENGIEGRVRVAISISSDGAIIGARIIDGIGYGCDEAVLDLIGDMPDWIPGKIYGKAVTSRYMLPVRFQISDWSRTWD